MEVDNGIIYGGLGGLIEYQIFSKDNFRITPFTGLGVSLGGTDTTTIVYYWLSYAVGLNLEYGKKHRLIQTCRNYGVQTNYLVKFSYLYENSRCHQRIFGKPEET